MTRPSVPRLLLVDLLLRAGHPRPFTPAISGYNNNALDIGPPFSGSGSCNDSPINFIGEIPALALGVIQELVSIPGIQLSGRPYKSVSGGLSGGGRDA